jgi:ketosteroid isomerase-like protein
VTVGWDAVRAAWEASNNSFVTRTVELSESHMAVNGDIAWEVGIEIGSSQRKGEPATTGNRNITANVYQEIDGEWLMVSHVVHPVPQPLR